MGEVGAWRDHLTRGSKCEWCRVLFVDKAGLNLNGSEGGFDWILIELDVEFELEIEIESKIESDWISLNLIEFELKIGLNGIRLNLIKFEWKVEFDLLKRAGVNLNSVQSFD